MPDCSEQAKAVERPLMSFEKGGIVPKTGMAYLQKGDTVLPNPVRSMNITRMDDRSFLIEKTHDPDVSDEQIKVTEPNLTALIRRLKKTVWQN